MRRPLSPAASAAIPPLVDGVVMPDSTPDARDLMQAIVATGGSWGGALGMVAATYGPEAARAIFDKRIARMRKPESLLAVLGEVAEGYPGIASAWLGDLIQTGALGAWINPSEQRALDLSYKTWVTSLPNPLHVDGHLYLINCVGITSLPSDLTVDGWLDLMGCRNLDALPAGLRAKGIRLNSSGIRSLPAGLDVGDLAILGCRHWDGKIPLDARIALLVTEEHVAGISLEAWRRLHPDGE